MSRNAGCRARDVDDPVQGARIAVRLLYPTDAPERSEPFGPFRLRLAMDAPVCGLSL